jgi:HEAT repeat protein
MGLFGPPNIERLKAKRDVPALIRALVGHHNDRVVRMAAADALGEVGDMRAFPALEATIKDPDEGVRQAAARAVLKVTDHNPGEASQPSASTTKDSCKAFKDGRCVVQGRDTGPCSWNPEQWEACSVVIENKKYGTW